MTRRSWFCGCIEFSQSSNPAYPGGFWVGGAYCGPVPQAHHHAGNLQFLPGDNVLRFRKLAASACQRTELIMRREARFPHFPPTCKMRPLNSRHFNDFLLALLLPGVFAALPYSEVMGIEQLAKSDRLLRSNSRGDDAKVSVPQ